MIKKIGGNFIRTNMIQDNDINHMINNFGGKGKKLFFSILFSTSLCRLIQIFVGVLEFELEHFFISLKINNNFYLIILNVIL